ncbi:MAG: glucoamylase family protein [Terriglobales bacterium]
MPPDTHIEMLNAEAERLPEPPKERGASPEALGAAAADLGRRLVWLPGAQSANFFSERYRALCRAIKPVLRFLHGPVPKIEVGDDFRWLYDNLRALHADLRGTREGFKLVRKLPHVRTPDGATAPRVVALAAGFLAATGYDYSESALVTYVQAFQQSTALKVVELWALVPALKLVLLEEIAARGSKVVADPAGSYGAGICVRSLRDIGQTSWKDTLEPMVLFNRILRQDPAGAYARMDFDSRDLYRTEIANIAEHSDLSEGEVAAAALALARSAHQETHASPRLAARLGHVGYYLLAEGSRALYERVGFQPPLGQRIGSFLRRHPDEFYLPGTEVLTLAIMSAIVLLLTNTYTSPELIFFSLLMLLLPCSQSAIQLVNYLITSLLEPQILPKLNFSEGVPDNCATLVAIPSMLFNRTQVRRLVEDLEVRFLGNHDPNIHFALLTDLPDSPVPAPEDDPLIDYCVQLVSELNEKYSSQASGSFFLFHRHRVYNARERVWMGWERKRGKLMDLNKLLRKEHDSFPVKTGDLSILPQIRFVITLDADTELPRGSADRMIGAMAHPLNQAIIDPEKNIVVAGYGILQPRVGVSVQSASRSRLASLYSGETGFDIYTRAISDVYQDLYGEGIFAGKGIYEMDTVHRVLDRRFPRNALLSHDLIEGAYARAGLASDVEIIEDYPSHYSAYNRRKHRWLRGDWQITGWLLSRVPDESGRKVPNPISLVSQWKILDNLRRSLVEPATFLLLVFGWLVLPGNPLYWTLATIGILFVPAWFQFLFNLVRAAVERKSQVVKDARSALLTANASMFFTLSFLPHQMLLSLDAVVRTLVRRLVTRRRLLEWETAAETELSIRKRTPVDIYLDWMPALAVGLGALVFFTRRHAFFSALPILLLWGCSKWISMWLNLPSRAMRSETSDKDELFLSRTALLTWRYFAEFSTEEHNWLIPDNVQEQPAVIAGRISPTNLGFLLNARQVACEFGFLTVPEFAEQTLRTLATMDRLSRTRGHLFNWYDTRTLEPLRPRFISSVDSGNLVASLWTLQQGCLDLLQRPLLEKQLAEGLADHLRMLVERHAFPHKRFKTFLQQIRKRSWLQRLLAPSEEGLLESDLETVNPKYESDVRWFAGESLSRVRNLRKAVQVYAPWMLPEFVPLWNDPALDFKFDVPSLTVQRLPEVVDRLTARLQFALEHANGSGERKALYQRLLAMLPEARSRARELIEDLEQIALAAGKFADEMDFRFLLDPRRKLLSLGFDVDAGKIPPACYDLLASEARIAVFAAIAKEDVQQDTWFLLGRAHTREHGFPVLLSWTGTMFEYLMPVLWMKTYPNTLLDNSRISAVRLQQIYATEKGVPWGISESAHAKRDESGNYQYQAFGLPDISLHHSDADPLVISPYSTFLALHVDAAGGLRNLRRMEGEGWLGPYGFYEAADYNPPSGRHSWRHRHELVRCWMAHHQGMTLLALANFLHDGVVQGWFHNDRRVQATELLLHERPATNVKSFRQLYGTAA